MLAKFLTVNVPSLCVINGHCYAGGLILALCHDFRTMHVNGGKLCLSEINVGMSLAPAYDVLCKSLMGVQIYRDMVMGRAILPKEAFDTRVISSLYTSEEDVMKQVHSFAKEFAPRAANRKVLKDIKQKLHRKAVNVCETVAFTPFDIESITAATPGAKL